MNIEQIAKQLADGIPRGGATIDMQGAHVREGIAVGIQDQSTKLDVGAAINHDYAYRQIKAWLKGIETHYPEHLHSAGTAFGIWVDSGVVYLDVVRIYNEHDLVPALNLARKHKQQAIQLLSPSVTMYLTFCE